MVAGGTFGRVQHPAEIRDVACDGFAFDADLLEALLGILQQRRRLLLGVLHESLRAALGAAEQLLGGCVRVGAELLGRRHRLGLELLGFRALLGGASGGLGQLRGGLVQILLGGCSGLLLLGQVLLLGLVPPGRELDLEVCARLGRRRGERRGLRVALVLDPRAVILELLRDLLALAGQLAVVVGALLVEL